MRHADLFTPSATVRIATPPGASYEVLLWGDRVVAQGSRSTLRLNPLYRLTTGATGVSG